MMRKKNIQHGREYHLKGKCHQIVVPTLHVQFLGERNNEQTILLHQTTELFTGKK
jgi:hypothetical protein